MKQAVMTIVDESEEGQNCHDPAYAHTLVLKKELGLNK